MLISRFLCRLPVTLLLNSPMHRPCYRTRGGILSNLPSRMCIPQYLDLSSSQFSPDLFNNQSSNDLFSNSDQFNRPFNNNRFNSK